jgi:hypothetical protein
MRLGREVSVRAIDRVCGRASACGHRRLASVVVPLKPERISRLSALRQVLEPQAEIPVIGYWTSKNASPFPAGPMRVPPADIGPKALVL